MIASSLMADPRQYISEIEAKPNDYSLPEKYIRICYESNQFADAVAIGEKFAARVNPDVAKEILFDACVRAHRIDAIDTIATNALSGDEQKNIILSRYFMKKQWMNVALVFYEKHLRELPESGFAAMPLINRSMHDLSMDLPEYWRLSEDKKENANSSEIAYWTATGAYGIFYAFSLTTLDGGYIFRPDYPKNTYDGMVFSNGTKGQLAMAVIGDVDRGFSGCMDTQYDNDPNRVTPFFVRFPVTYKDSATRRYYIYIMPNKNNLFNVNRFNEGLMRIVITYSSHDPYIETLVKREVELVLDKMRR